MLRNRMPRIGDPAVAERNAEKLRKKWKLGPSGPSYSGRPGYVRASAFMYDCFGLIPSWRSK